MEADGGQRKRQGFFSGQPHFSSLSMPQLHEQVVAVLHDNVGTRVAAVRLVLTKTALMLGHWHACMHSLNLIARALTAARLMSMDVPTSILKFPEGRPLYRFCFMNVRQQL
jgi:hypothetical protein